MAQDLRELFREEKGKKHPMKKGHECFLALEFIRI